MSEGECSSARDARLGRILYWTATIIAGLIVAAVVAGYVSDSGEGVPFYLDHRFSACRSYLARGVDLPRSFTKLMAAPALLSAQ